jgi:hypothetical protein
MKKLILIPLLSSILITIGVDAQVITLKQIGKDNMLISSNMGLSIHNSGTLYSIDQTGSIIKTDLASGDFSRLGKATYKNLKFFFTANNRLFVIDNDGSMTQIDPVSGNWSVVSSMFYWRDIVKVVVVANSFYAIENGVLYKYIGFNKESRKQIGEAEFYNVGTLIKFETALYNMMDDGSFYEINTDSGKWKKIGKSKTWKGNLSAVVKDKLYTIDNSGALYETALSDGTKKQIDNTQFKKARFLFEDTGKLYISTTEGTLHEVVIN